MAPNVSVPMNFGIRLLDSPTHSTLELKASQGAVIPASSVILSFNSPVIDHMTTTLHLTSVDMEEFSEDAVRYFVHAVYTAETPLIPGDMFRDINKMSHVFKVTWLVDRCVGLFSQLADANPQPSYTDLLFIFEEAAFALTKLNCQKLKEIVFAKIKSSSMTKEFIAKYIIEDLCDRLALQIDLIIELAGSNVQWIIEPFAQYLMTKVTTEEAGIHPNCKHILQICDLSKCQEEDADLFENIFDSLEKLAAGCSEDLIWVLQLHRNLCKRASIKSSPRK